MDYKEIAAGTETIPNKRFFTPEEKEQMRIEHTDKLIELDAHEQEIKDLKDSKSPVIKELKTTTKKTRNLLRAGFEYQNRECYLVPNHESGKMEYIDTETSELLFERKLLPAEKQLRITDRKLA